MNELACEMCGSNDIVKQDGLYVCQSCGTKYSVEEAKKMMINGVVQIDHSNELENLYEVARRARDSDNAENALNYYNQILTKDPNSWEAQFYVVYFRAAGCRIIEISNSAYAMMNNIDPVLTLVKKNVDEESLYDVLLEITIRYMALADMFKEASKNTYMSVDYEFRDDYNQEYVDRILPTNDMMYLLGNGISELFGDKYSDLSVLCWKKGIEIHQTVIYLLIDKKSHKDIIIDYGKKINKFDKTYEAPYKPEVQLEKVKTPNSPKTNEPPSENKSGGCYIATSVYGSYDCPEVWTLRRFRDNILENHVLGRLFIKLYYFTSPTLVKYFGHKKLFKKTFKPILDKFVQKLNTNGIESNFYRDK